MLGDQRVIAGLGNIYVCEALWRARLSPRRAAGTLVRVDGKPTERLMRLVEAVRAVIADAIEAGGSSLRDYVQANGELGLFQHRFAVYDREGKPCRAGCGGIDPPHRPVGPLDLLLPGLPALRPRSLAPDRSSLTKSGPATYRTRPVPRPAGRGCRLPPCSRRHRGARRGGTVHESGTDRMANTPSAKKAARKIAHKTAVNMVPRTRMRSFVRKVEEAIASGDKTAARRRRSRQRSR